MHNPWSRIIRLESDGRHIPLDSTVHNITPNRVIIVIYTASRTSDDIEHMLLTLSVLFIAISINLTNTVKMDRVLKIEHI